MSKNLIKTEIINQPQYYFHAQRKTLEARLDEIKLDDEIEKKIIEDKTKETIRDKVLGTFKIGELVNTIINWNNEVDEDLREAKKEVLLSNYFQKIENAEFAINHIQTMLTNPQGNTLFNKIIRILDNYPPDLELMGHLSSVLLYITETDFVKLFEQHKYALSQIEILTPQALTILSDYKKWPEIQMGSYQSMGTKITSDWLNEFSSSYGRSKGITDGQIIERIGHSINELINSRLIEDHMVRNNTAKSIVTNIGKVILPYITR